MNNSTYPFLLILFLVFSAFFSSAETAFSALNKIRLKYMANNGDKKAAKTLEIADNFSAFISTILVGNNVVNIVSASLATLYFTKLLGDQGAAVSSLVMTVAVIIFGEIIPKRIAKIYPERYAMAISSFVAFMMVVLKPLTFIFDLIGNFVENRLKKNEEDDFNSEEFITMVEEAEEEGNMDENQAEIITNSIEFNDIDVGEIFTPRVDVVAISNKDSYDEIEKKFRESGYSRLPYFEDTIDQITGVIHEKDFFNLYYKKSNTPIKKIAKKVIFTSETVKISGLLRQLQSQKSHMAIVVDEYGGTAGIITMEDILEELVGEIYDEHDEIIEYFKKTKDDKYIINCDGDIEEMFEYLGIDNDEEYEYNTVSGWVIDNFDKIPEVGESFDYKNLHCEVTKADERSVSEVEIFFVDEELKDE